MSYAVARVGSHDKPLHFEEPRPVTQSSTGSRTVISYLKWVGGKTRYAATLCSMFPDDFDRYFEPFVGSGAVYLTLRPELATLSDANQELVVCHQQVASSPESVMTLLDAMPKTKERFHEIRAQDPASLTETERAARVIYLNKQCFRGLWRVNRKGQFNVPWGDVPERALYDRDTVLRCSQLLRQAEIRSMDFEEALAEAGDRDLVYLDPPYVPLGGWADFKRYTPGQFHEEDHRRLEAAMASARDRGAHVVMTNSNTDLVREIWADWHIERLETVRDISIDSRSRASSDLIISSYDLPRTRLF